MFQVEQRKNIKGRHQHLDNIIFVGDLRHLDLLYHKVLREMVFHRHVLQLQKKEREKMGNEGI